MGQPQTTPSPTPYRMVRASALEPGPALLVVSLPSSTVRGTVARVQRGWTQTVRVQLSSGLELTLQESSMVGLVDRLPAGRRQAPKGGRR